MTMMMMKVTVTMVMIMPRKMMHACMYACLAIFFRGPHYPEAQRQGVTHWRLEVTQA